MTHPHISKLREGITRIKQRANWERKLGIAATGAILITGAVWWLALPLPKDYETDIPAQPRSYTVFPVACNCSDKTGGQISLRFHPDEPAQNEMPAYKIEENIPQTKTVVSFENVANIVGQFDYEDVTNCPFIESVNYFVKNGVFIVEISRKGAYLPARLSTQGPQATVILEPATQNYPLIVNQKPADNSAAFPALHPISFDAVIEGSLKSASVFFQGDLVKNATTTVNGNTYHFSFDRMLEIDKEYSVKAVIADNQNRTTVRTWSFTGQIPSAVALGKDRFKYLGWWGRINADGVTVRKGVATTSDRVGTLSSANRIKVLKEVYGDWVNGKNLWYQIDGGAYPGAYVFSEFVTPMEQPAPPQKVDIPSEVAAGEKWIDVDLVKKVLTLFDYDKPVFATYISSGRKENPTQTGTYRVWYKLVKTEMKGGPPLHSYKYDLKNIPWAMFYNFDYAIHGTYWHDKFGTPQSAGCTNMTQGDAKFIFDNTLPVVPAGKQSEVSRNDSNKGTGTVVHNHD